MVLVLAVVGHPQSLSEDQKAFYTAEFNKCAKSGMISNLNDFAKLTRALGQNYTPGELQTKLGGSKNLQGFLDLMSQTLVHEDTNQDVIEAFKVYDKDGNGLMDMVALRFVLLNQGDKLDNEQAEAIMSRISSHNGSFNYHSMVEQYSKMSGRG